MKITQKLSLLFLVMITALSCDELDELTEIDITDDFSVTTTITAEETGTFSQSATIDLTVNQEIQDNLDLIESVSINSLTYEIKNFVPGEGAENAVITGASLTIGTASISVSNINLQEADNANTATTIDDADFLSAVTNALQNDSEVTISVFGMVDATPVTFDITINADVTVTVDII